MPKFLPIEIENDRVQYLNLELIRVVNDHPDEDGVRIDFDEHHRLYLDRERAEPLLRLLKKTQKPEA